MKKSHFNTIIKYVNLLCPEIRKPKHTPSYYLKNILCVLTDVVKWSSLKTTKRYIGKKEYHYKSIARIHRKWCKSGVYKQAYDEIILNNDNLYDTSGSTIELLIDSTLIINKGGIECVGYGSECKKKRFTKLTAICNTAGNNIAIYPNNVISKTVEKHKVIKKEIPLIASSIKTINAHCNNMIAQFDNFLIDRGHNKNNNNIINNKSNDNKSNGNKSNGNKSNDNKAIDNKSIGNKSNDNKAINDQSDVIRKTLEHDVKGIIPIMKMIGRKCKPIDLIGDKGYNIGKNDRKLLKKINTRMIAPKRKNQKIKNTDEEKSKLKKRYKIENLFAKIKVFNRVHVRRDKLINNYLGFVYLACIYISPY